MSTKLVQICCNFGPYHLARINGVVEKCKDNDWEIFGIELARSEEEYPWETESDKFPCEIISIINNVPLEKSKFSKLFTKLITVLDQYSPNAVAISGYARPSMLVALLWCLWNGKSAILLSETTEYDETRSWWKEQIKRMIVKKFKSALVGGHPQKRYLVKLGMPENAIFLGYDVVGNDVFHPNQIKLLPHPLNKPFFLAINRFVNKKNILFLISAYAAYRQTFGIDA